VSGPTLMIQTVGDESGSLGHGHNHDPQQMEKLRIHGSPSGRSAAR